MTETADAQEEGLVVTVGACMDPTHDLWMVTGPFWDDGQPGASEGAFSVMIDGRAEAMDHANGIAALQPGCKVVTFERGV